MKGKHKKTMAAIATDPVLRTIKFDDVDSLLTSEDVGAERSISGSHYIYRLPGKDPSRSRSARS